MHIDFKGKTAVVTGATRGIGASIAKRLQDSGASLILTGTNKKQIASLNLKLEKNNIKNIRYEHIDFLDSATLSAFVEVLSRKKKIDICINNAGINILNTFENISPADFENTFSVNCKAPFLICQAVAEVMKRNQYGRIVNISSIWSIVTKAGRGSYTTAKSALVGLSRTMAVELAPHNILVNCVSPGFIKTELTDKNLTKSEQAELRKIIPIQRFGNPDELAELVLFLASDVNTYITAQNIIADGGFTSV